MGKSLLVIGGSSDIGIGTIQDIHENYDVIIAHYNHMNEKLEVLKAELGEKLICIRADLSEEGEINYLINGIQKQGVIPSHILHLPAVPVQMRKFHKTEWSVYQNQIDISVKSAVMILSSFLPDMIKNKGGKIILMLSMAVNHMPPNYHCDYVMTKYALMGMMKSLAVEYAEKGITVNGISPALVETRFVNEMHDYLIEQNAKANPIGRNLKVEDIVPTIKYLFSQAADCINGQNISITCGR